VLRNYAASYPRGYAQLPAVGNAWHPYDFTNIYRAGFRLADFGVTISRAQALSARSIVARDCI